MKILKFLNHFYIGGTERQFVHVANGLDRLQFDVELGCLRREGPLLDSLDPGLPIHTYPLKGTFFHYKSMLSQLRFARDVRKRRIDIVHAYGWYTNIFAIPPAWMAHRPAIIASIRDAGAYTTPAKIKALKFTCVLADCVLANSMAGRTWLLEQGVNESKIEVIRNGIALPAQFQRVHEGPFRKEFGIPGNAAICACVGRVVSGKGIDDYLRAAHILSEQGRDVRFLMIGALSVERNYRSEMETLARELNLEGRVIFTGQRQDVSAILQEVDVVVHPSLTEGLSNVILEAMGAGLPVVASRVGGNPELVEDGRTGFLVPAKSAVEIARAIGRLLDQPSMARSFGEKGRQRVLEEFTIGQMLGKTEALYRRLLEERMLSGRFETMNSERAATTR